MKKELSYKKQKEANDKVNSVTNNLYSTKIYNVTMFLWRIKSGTALISDDCGRQFTARIGLVGHMRIHRK